MAGSFRGPSPAAVIGVIAIILAISGAAYAGTKIDTRDLASGAVTSKKIAGGAVTTKKLAQAAVKTRILADGSVKTKKISADAVTGAEVNESTLEAVPLAETANTATNAVNGAPFAYARVTQAGTVIPALSKNIADANITNPADGRYCFDLPFTPLNGQATGQAQGGADDIVHIELAGADDPPGGCPAGTEVAVRNYDVSAGAQQNDAFYISLFL